MLQSAPNDPAARRRQRSPASLPARCPARVAAMSRAHGLAAEAAMEENQQTPSKDAQKAMSFLPSFVRRVSAHQFLLAELPPDLRDALADYDVDGDGAFAARARLAWTHVCTAA